MELLKKKISEFSKLKKDYVFVKEVNSDFRTLLKENAKRDMRLEVLKLKKEVLKFREKVLKLKDSVSALQEMVTELNDKAKVFGDLVSWKVRTIDLNV